VQHISDPTNREPTAVQSGAYGRPIGSLRPSNQDSLLRQRVGGQVAARARTPAIWSGDHVPPCEIRPQPDGRSCSISTRRARCEPRPPDELERLRARLTASYAIRGPTHARRTVPAGRAGGRAGEPASVEGGREEALHESFITPSTSRGGSSHRHRWRLPVGRCSPRWHSRSLRQHSRLRSTAGRPTG